MMMTRIGVLIVAVLTASTAAAEKTVKQTFTSGGRSRTCYVFVKSVWQFLQQHRLEGDPKYQTHQFR
jgi:hypothetical protein